MRAHAPKGQRNQARQSQRGYARSVSREGHQHLHTGCGDKAALAGILSESDPHREAPPNRACRIHGELMSLFQVVEFLQLGHDE